MKDTRIVIDAVRNKIPPTAKMLVCWIGDDGFLHASQANVTQTDVARMAEALRASTIDLPGGLLRAA
jgi:hypothetical protein